MIMFVDNLVLIWFDGDCLMLMFNCLYCGNVLILELLDGICWVLDMYW